MAWVAGGCPGWHFLPGLGSTAAFSKQKPVCEREPDSLGRAEECQEKALHT